MFIKYKFMKKTPRIDVHTMHISNLNNSKLAQQFLKTNVSLENPPSRDSLLYTFITYFIF